MKHNKHMLVAIIISIVVYSLLMASSTEIIEEEVTMEGQIIKVYQQELPATRFIGKKGFGWDTWFQNGWFEVLEGLIDEDFKNVYEDWGAYLGLYRFEKDDTYEYYIGMLLPENTTVPEGFEHIDFPKSTLGVCWAYGAMPTVHSMMNVAYKRLEDDGYTIAPDKNGAVWCIERCGCPRYTDPDEKGNVILDFCFIVE